MRRIAVRKLLKERRKMGYFHALISEIRLNDTESFINFHCMDHHTFGLWVRNKNVVPKQLVNPAYIWKSIGAQGLASCKYSSDLLVLKC